MAKIRSKPGIFCFEGQWSSNLATRTSVRRLLEFLGDSGIANVIHRDVATVEELQFYLNKWPQKAYRNYRIGYFAFHGSPGQIHLGRKKLTIESMADLVPGGVPGKDLFFGSCGTLGCKQDRIDEFLRRMKARSVLGYQIDVPWFPAVAFELILFDALTRHKKIDAVERHLAQYKKLRDELRFRLHR